MENHEYKVAWYDNFDLRHCTAARNIFLCNQAQNYSLFSNGYFSKYGYFYLIYLLTNF